jgi:hypothetical protein
VSYRIDVHAHLHSEEETGVALDSVGGAVYVNDSHIVQAAAQDAVGCQSHRADVDKGQKASLVGRENVVFHGPVIQKPGASGIDASGDSRGEAALVGGDGAAGASVVEMAVQVDEAWGDQFAGHVYHVAGPLRVDSFGHLSNFPVMKRYVPAAMNLLGWVQQGATLEK